MVVDFSQFDKAFEALEGSISGGFGALNLKVDRVSENVNKHSERLTRVEGKIESMPTSIELAILTAIGEHRETCNDDKVAPPKSNGNGNAVLVKAITALVAALAILGAVIAATS